MTAITFGLFYLSALGVRLGRRLHRDESGQDLFEYVLLTAGVSVTIASILIVGFELIVPQVLETLCPSVDPLGVDPMGNYNCLP